MGTVSPARVDELLQESRALLLPARWNEPNPRSVAEAYAAGVPVIASNIGGLGEMVDHNVSGIRVPAGAPSGWAEALHTLMEDGASIRLGEGAFEQWRREYAPDRGLERLESAYGEAP